MQISEGADVIVKTDESDYWPIRRISKFPLQGFIVIWLTCLEIWRSHQHFLLISYLYHRWFCNTYSIVCTLDPIILKLFALGVIKFLHKTSKLLRSWYLLFFHNTIIEWWCLWRRQSWTTLFLLKTRLSLQTSRRNSWPLPRARTTSQTKLTS